MILALDAWGEQVVITGVVVIVVVFACGGLFALRKAAFSPLPALLWTIWIVCVPVLGPLTFFIVKPRSTLP